MVEQSKNRTGSGRSAVIVLAVVAALALLWFIPSPVDKFRLADGYLPNTMEYRGHNQYRVNGKHVRGNPIVYIGDPASKQIDANLEEWLGDAQLSGKPQVTRYEDNFNEDGPLSHDPASTFLGYPRTLRERAIYTIYHQIQNRQPVNILIGEQSTVNGVDVEGFDNFKNRKVNFYNPFLYLEEKDGVRSAVVVAVRHLISNDNVFQFAEGPVDTEYATVLTGDYLTEWDKLRVWTAREITTCDPAAVVPGCLYASKSDLYKGQEKFVYTTQVNVTEGNEQSSQRGDRNVFTHYTISVRGNKQIFAGTMYYPGQQFIDGSTLNRNSLYRGYGLNEITKLLSLAA